MKLQYALEVGDLTGLVVILVLFMVGPPLLLFLVGLKYRKTSQRTAKVLYIIAGIYLLVGLGICGGLMGAF